MERLKPDAAKLDIKPCTDQDNTNILFTNQRPVSPPFPIKAISILEKETPPRRCAASGTKALQSQSATSKLPTPKLQRVIQTKCAGKLPHYGAAAPALNPLYNLRIVSRKPLDGDM